MDMPDFIELEGSGGETIIVNRSEISSVVCEDGDTESILYMRNGNEFTIKGTAEHIFMYKIGTKQI